MEQDAVAASTPVNKTAEETRAAADRSVVRRVTLSPDPESSDGKRSRSDSDSATLNESRQSANNNATANIASESTSATMAESDKDDDPPIEREAKRARTMPVPLGPLPMPTLAERTNALEAFANPADQALQKLIWDIGCRYTLLPHQPEAVRAVAGLPASFPHFSDLESGTDRTPSTAKFKAFNIQSKTKGILLADEMVSRFFNLYSDYKGIHLHSVFSLILNFLSCYSFRV
jgi:hypothetical protein